MSKAVPEGKLLQRALVLTIAAPILWSTGGICIRLLNISPWTILFYRTLIMSLTIIIWILIKQDKTKTGQNLLKNIARGLPVSILLGLSLCFYVLSMKNTGIADSLLIQGTAPLFIIIFGRVFLKDLLGKRTLIAIIGVTTGFMFIFLPALSGSRLNGNVFGLIKALAFALNVIALRKLKDIDMLPATAVAAIIACCISLIFVDSFSLSYRDLFVLLYFGMIQTGLAFILFSTWSGYIPSPKTGIIVLLESVLGPLWVWLFFNEKPADMTLIGGVIIIASLVFNSSRKSFHQRNQK